MKRIHPLQQPVHADVTLPGSLSYTIRALNLAAMTPEPVTLYNPLFSDDTEAMMQCLETLGVRIGTGDDFITVYGNINDIKDQEYTLNINISGRTARTLLGLLCVVPGTKILTCESGFRKRPVGEMVNGLRQLGAEIEYLEEEGFLPLKITSSSLKPGTVKMKGTISSQYFSGIMMIAPRVGRIEIQVEGEQASKPFIDVTIATMNEFGVNVINNEYHSYIVEGGQTYKQQSYIIEADAISASYFWGIAAITGSTIKVLHLSPDSHQGDVKFADIMEQMGCTVVKNKDEKWIEVTGPKELKAVDVNMNNTPDSVQTLAVVGAYANGTTHITGLEHLKVKETDRIEAPKSELLKMGVQVESTNDSLTITGGTPHGAEIKTYGDHRMAMSFAVAGTRTEGISIVNPEVVSKSFPSFWETLRALGVKLPESNYKNCIICGFRATGKTSVGPMIAQALGWNYLEMDYLITSESGKTVAELTQNGASWQEFRELETSILKDVLEMENVVISAGGGVGVNNHLNKNTNKPFGEEQALILKNHPETAVYVLTASTDVISKRLRSDEEMKETVQRPLLNEDDAQMTNLDTLSKSEHIEKIISDTLATWKEREPLYKALSDSIIDTSTVSIKETAYQIVELLKK
jgi:3-phosphoshikimate 1-carboxyvinyltransferase